MITANHEVQASQFDLESIKSVEKGMLSLEGSYGYSRNPGSTQFLNDVNIGLTFSRDLYTGGVSDARIRQAAASVQQAKLNLKKTELSVAREIREAFSIYQGNVAAVDARMLVFNGAKDSYAITKELYAFSRISLFEVLSSQEQLFNSGRQLINSIVDRAISKYRLLRVTHELQEQLEYFGK